MLATKLDPLSNDELNSRLRVALTADRTRLSNLCVLALTRLHPKIVTLLSEKHDLYCNAVIEFTARESKTLLLSILEGRKLGSEEVREPAKGIGLFLNTF